MPLNDLAGSDPGGERAAADSIATARIRLTCTLLSCSSAMSVLRHMRQQEAQQHCRVPGHPKYRRACYPTP
jgi:hypothetical protein